MDAPALAFARGVVVGAVVLAVAVNIAQFLVIDREIGQTYAAVNSYPSSTVSDVVTEHTPTVRARFELYTELRHWAFGAELLLAPDVRLRHDQLVGLSGLSAVGSWADPTDVSGDDLARIDAHVVWEGEDRDTGPAAVAIASSGVERMIALRESGRLLLVDERLLEGAAT